jgi:hypothetical protein
MASIQITDLNSSNSEFLYELTDDEILDINGGGFFSDLLGIGAIVVGVIIGSPTLVAAGVIALDGSGSGGSGGSSRGGGGSGGSGRVSHALL